MDARPTTRFTIFAHDDPTKPLGKSYHSNLDATKAWDGAKHLARTDFKQQLTEAERETHVISKEFWIYRYEFQYPANMVEFTRALCRLLSGDYSECVDEMEVCCIWYERRGDGARFLCESMKGKDDPSPKTKRISKYAK